LEKLLEIKNLKTHFYTSEGVFPAVDDVSFHIDKGETLAVVGESGCGKSVTARSILRIVPSPPGRYVQGEIFFKGSNLLKLSEKKMREIRGRDIAMIFQEPMSSLNPAYRIGDQIMETIRIHGLSSSSSVRQRAMDLLKKVGMPDPDRRLNEYPHQLSGGMCQRAMIAMALSCNPQLLIADEPTTALDVTIQAQILELLKQLKRDTGMSIMMITHDLGVVAEVADRVVVMYAGKVVEEASVVDIFKNPQHPYTEGLLQCLPRVDIKSQKLMTIEGYVPGPLDYPKGCRFRNRCEYAQEICQEEPSSISCGKGFFFCHFTPDERKEMVRWEEKKSKNSLFEKKSLTDFQKPLVEVDNLVKHYPIWGGILNKQIGEVRAVDGVSFSVRKGETFGLVGESGCGKSTTGRTILMLDRPTKGNVFFNGKDLLRARGKELRDHRRNMQIVFQDPFDSLNPRMRVGNIISEPLKVHKVGNNKEQEKRVQELLEVVGLPPQSRYRFPHEFSGGQRQRIGIARSLALNPQLIICDEPVSALDVSIQAQIINLFVDLQKMYGLTYVFIAHGLNVIHHISDRVGVMYLGKIVEIGESAELFKNPRHPYTEALLSAIPIPDPEKKTSPKILEGDIPSPVNPPSGCRFHTRCPIAADICKEVEPSLTIDDGNRWVACHLRS